jgi:hypothetical protein
MTGCLWALAGVWKSSIMAPPQAQAVAAGGAGPVQQQQGGGGGFLQKILMYVMIYFVAQQFLSPKKTMDPAKLTSNLVNKGEKLVSTSIFAGRICVLE